MYVEGSPHIPATPAVELLVAAQFASDFDSGTYNIIGIMSLKRSVQKRTVYLFILVFGTCVFSAFLRGHRRLPPPIQVCLALLFSAFGDVLLELEAYTEL